MIKNCPFIKMPSGLPKQCLRDQCAIWIEESDCCSFVSMADDLTALSIMIRPQIEDEEEKTDE